MINTKNQKKLSRREFISKSTQTAVLLPLLNITSAKSVFPNSTKAGRKISVFSKHLHWQNYDDMAKTVAQIGFDGVDLTVRPRGHVLPENVEKDLPRAVEACKRAGVEVIMLTTAINSIDSPYAETVLKTAGNLGIGIYRLDWINYDKNLTIDKNLEKIKIQLKELSDLNQKYMIKGGYQNHAGANFGSAVWDLALLLNEIDSPWLGCQYDIRHATLEGANCWPTGFRFVAPYINSIDIKDFFWGKTRGRWQPQNGPLGEGMVDFESYFSMLKDLKIDVPVSLHLEYPLGGAEQGRTKLTVEPEVVTGAMKKDLDWLKEKLDKFGI
jgi:L-ribulose-5-phosphate 3-epimerase